LVESLDDAVRAGQYRWKTAINIYGVVTGMLRDAYSSKRTDLRVRDDNPAVGVRGPDRGELRDGPYLYPKEVVRLLECEDVPDHVRAAYAVATYTGLRWGELQVLRREHVQLDGKYIWVARSLNRVTKEEKGTKSGRSRRVPIEPSLMPLMRSLVRSPQGKGGLLLDLPIAHTHAEKLRRHLARAGIRRQELYSHDDRSRQVNFHSLRHSYATWLALSGHNTMVIQQRGGWGDLSMVQRYVEEAEAVGRGDIGVPFPPLPSGLLMGTRMSGGVETSCETSCGGEGVSQAVGKRGEFERGGRDFLPCTCSTLSG